MQVSLFLGRAVAVQIEALAVLLDEAIDGPDQIRPLRNEPRRMACSVMMPNHRSTWLIQEA